MDLMIIMPNMFYLNKYLYNFTMKITKYENRIKRLANSTNDVWKKH